MSSGLHEPLARIPQYHPTPRAFPVNRKGQSRSFTLWLRAATFRFRTATSSEGRRGNPAARRHQPAKEVKRLSCIQRRSSMTVIKFLSAGLIAAAMFTTPADAHGNFLARRHVIMKGNASAFSTGRWADSYARIPTPHVGRICDAALRPARWHLRQRRQWEDMLRKASRC